jgi:hypothetical protein
MAWSDDGSTDRRGRAYERAPVESGRAIDQAKIITEDSVEIDTFLQQSGDDDISRSKYLTTVKGGAKPTRTKGP